MYSRCKPRAIFRHSPPAGGRIAYNKYMYVVYAIYNTYADKIYIGQTSNMETRLIEHNQKRGNHYTAMFEGEWKLIYTESVPTRSEALKREKQLKSFKGREYIKSHIPA